MTARRPGKRLTRTAYAELERAFAAIEENTFASRLARLSFEHHDQSHGTISKQVLHLTERMLEPALEGALAIAIRTLGKEESKGRTEGTVARHFHKIAASLSGAAGGATGIPGLIAELPLTTILMLRRIADIARRNGEDLSTPEARLACLEVFALSGLGAASETAGTTYYAVRIAFHGTVAHAGRVITGKGFSLGNRVMSAVASRVATHFGGTVARLAATRVLPLAGAAGGALLNALFMDHYQELAEAHFTIRRLERTYGHEAVHRAYEQMRRKRRTQQKRKTKRTSK